MTYRKPQFGVKGVNELRSSLKTAGADLGDLKRPLREAAQYVEETAAALAPRDSGRLLASLRSGATQRAGVVRAGSRAVPYAAPIHWGWPARGITPNPFISIAARRSEARWLPILEQHITAALEQVKGT